MALTTYTTTNHVRAVLGVSAKELSDTTLALDLWEKQFLLEMLDVDAGGGAVMTQYATVKDITDGNRTADQTRFLDLVNMLAAYSVARQLLSPQAMFAVQRVTDGRAEFERFNAANFDKVRSGVEATYTNLLRRLAAVLLVLDPVAQVPTAPTRRMIGAVGLGTDPVTGV